MCAISGWRAYGDARPDIGEVRRLFVALESGGTDAGGLAWINESGTKPILQVHKDGVKNSDGVKKVDLGLFSGVIPRMCIMHARHGTKGPATDNANNHPLFSKSGLAIVHNGVISNDDVLFTRFQWKREGIVDSEIILRLIEEKSKGFTNPECFDDLYGSFAVAAIWDKYPDKMWLIRDTSKLCVGIDRRREIVFFATTPSIIQSGVGTIWRGFRIPSTDMSWYDVADSTTMLLDSEGMSNVGEFKSKDYLTTYDDSFQHGGYGRGVHDTKVAGERSALYDVDDKAGGTRQSGVLVQGNGKTRSEDAGSVRCFICGGKGEPGARTILRQPMCNTCSRNADNLLS